MADLRRLPPGTLPPIVLKFDASSLPVCLITLKGEGLNETQLRDLGQFTVRNQLAGVLGRVGAAALRRQVPPDHGLRRSGQAAGVSDEPDGRGARGQQRQPDSAGGRREDRAVRLHALHQQPVPRRSPTSTASRSRRSARSTVTVGDVGHAEDGAPDPDQHRARRRPAVGLSAGDEAGRRHQHHRRRRRRQETLVGQLIDVPKELVTNVVFDQSLFVKRAIETLLDEGGIGLVLTALMVLVFLGSFRATVAVFLSIPLSALAAFIALYFGGSSINTMILAGFALVFSRLIDNAVIVLENIFRHLEMGEPPEVAAEKGGQEVALAVLAATLTSSIVFFPVTFLYGVSRFLFSALALAVVLSLFASYFVAMTVVPLFCAKLIKAPHHGRSTKPRRAPPAAPSGWMAAVQPRVHRAVRAAARRGTSAASAQSLQRPGRVVVGDQRRCSSSSLVLYPLLGVAFFPRTDAGQFVINLKSPSGTPHRGDRRRTSRRSRRSSAASSIRRISI